MVKTLLQEAPSVGSAIEKAWTEAGKPAEFSIKVIDQGESSFFGLITSKPFVVSFTCDKNSSPKHGSNSHQKDHQRRSHDRNDRDRRNERNERNERTESSRSESTERRFDRPERSERNERSERPARNDRFERSERSERKSSFDRPARTENHRSSEFAAREKTDFENTEVNANLPDEVWTDALQARAQELLTEIFSYLETDAKFTLSVTGTTLNVEMDQDVLGDENSQRSLFVSLSTLVMQIMRREFQKNVRGLRLLIKRA